MNNPICPMLMVWR